MLKFILKRILEAIPVLFTIATITFFMVKATPGGPFDAERKLPEETKAQLEAFYGLDKSWGEQYLMYMKNVCKGDFGWSQNYHGRRVSDIILERFPYSLELGIYAMGIALFVGLGLGIIASVRPNTWMDYSSMSIAMVGICLPTFVLGPLLLLVFSLHFGYFDSVGWSGFSDKVLPSITLGFYYAAYIARLTRGSMMEVRNQDYMRTAIAKGLSPARVYFIHGFRNAAQPIVAYLGPAMAGLISGSFVVETIFNIPGLGRFFTLAAINRDGPLVCGTVIFFAFLIVLFNFIVDLISLWLNPKLRAE